MEDRTLNSEAGNGNWWRPCNNENKLLIGPEHTLHWLQWHTSCSSCRPLSVSFLVHTSGKETPLATPLDMEKYRRFNFSPCKHEYLARNLPKLMMAHAEVEFGLFRFQFHALLRLGEPLFPRWSLKLLAKVFWSFVRPPADWLRFLISQSQQRSRFQAWKNAALW